MQCFLHLLYLPIEGLDVQVVSLVGAPDKADTRDVVEGQQTALDD